MGTLRTTYLALKKKTETTFPNAIFCVVTRRGSYKALAPTAELLKNVKELYKEFKNSGLIEDEAKWEAWHKSGYKRRYLDHIKNNPRSQEMIMKIRGFLNEGKNVYLVCYEKNPPCHRFLLQEYIIGS